MIAHIPNGAVRAAIDRLAGLFLACDSRCESAQADVRHERQQKSSDNNFERINEVRDDNLIDDIESHCEDEYFTDTLPAVSNEGMAGCGIGKNRP